MSHVTKVEVEPSVMTIPLGGHKVVYAVYKGEEIYGLSSMCKHLGKSRHRQWEKLLEIPGDYGGWVAVGTADEAGAEVTGAAGRGAIEHPANVKAGRRASF